MNNLFLKKPLLDNLKVDECNMSDLISELFSATISFHKLHLKITNLGSYAAHNALSGLYSALPEIIDSLVEQYQGVTENLIEIKEKSPKVLISVEDSLSYIREIYSMINTIQRKCDFSEIVNELDGLKSLLNSTKYKLKFLT